ncbi:MAG: AraC family transcriptional regulator [Oscillospiraceae bacterium]|nr:AraC family transcriptional regulator [Oscillospiraceae bacterium]
MQIQTGQTLELHNVLSYRAKMTQQEFAAKAQEIDARLREQGAQRVGSSATATFSVEPGAHGPVMDVEILIPLNKEITLPEGCVWKPHFLLTNALVVRHVGSPATMQESANALNVYISEHQLTPITVGYNVTVKEPKTPLELDEMIVDIYVGVSPNIL